MKKVAIIVAQNIFRDEEYLIPKEILENSGIYTETFSKIVGIATGKLGTAVLAELAIKDLQVNKFDGVIFVGGAGSRKYFNDVEAQRIAKEAFSSGKIVAAICSAVGILANAGILKGKKVTSFPDEAELITRLGGIHTGSDLEIDGKIITSDGPQSAKIFGEAILKALV